MGDKQARFRVGMQQLFQQCRFREQKWVLFLGICFLVGAFFYLGSHKVIDSQKQGQICEVGPVWPMERWAILVGGEPLVVLASEAEAKGVLEDLPTYYFSAGEIKVVECAFAEDVLIMPWHKLEPRLVTKKEALCLLAEGREKEAEHVVKEGESLWTIAQKHGLTVAEMESFNPDYQNKYLQPGDVVVLQKKEPLLTITSTVEVSVKEKMPYKIVYEQKQSLRLGEEKIKEYGKAGLRETTYRITKCNGLEIERELLAEKIVEEPRPRIIQRGTQVMIASRGGTSIFTWPVRGRITSPYGKKRGSSVHTGLDIGAPQGTSVIAAGKGRVISAGWKGGYGYCVDLDHGQRLVTRYAHLSKINVSVGQNVNQGSLLGKVGSTGNSTGPHLHFEVLVRGRHTNPLNYLP